MKKFWIIVLSVVLSIVLIFTSVYVYNLWQHIKYMEYCSFALEGDDDYYYLDDEVIFYDEVIFHLEDGRVYEVIPFPEGLERKDIVNALTSVKSEKITEQTGGESILYPDPFGEGSEYAVIAPTPELPPFFPKCSIAIPFAYYAVEVEPSENTQ